VLCTWHAHMDTWHAHDSTCTHGMHAQHPIRIHTARRGSNRAHTIHRRPTWPRPLLRRTARSPWLASTTCWRVSTIACQKEPTHKKPNPAQSPSLSLGPVVLRRPGRVKGCGAASGEVRLTVVSVTLRDLNTPRRYRRDLHECTDSSPRRLLMNLTGL
jgi:hypothetical protein